MSNPARAAREANPGFSQVKAKHRHGITLRNPATGKCCFETQVGQIYHYGPTLEEADSAWAQAADSNYLEMTKADFNLRARKSFSAGDLLKWSDPITGQYVILQPNNISWIDNVSGSQQFIASPVSVAAPSVNDDVLLWQNGYGPGRHFQYIASTTRLTKHLIIDSLTSLPAATVSNPYLELAFVMTPSSGVSLIVDGGTWNKKTTKTTVSAIEFRTSQGVTLWSFSAPTAHDSAGSEVAGIMQLRKQGGNLIVSVRFPKSWIDTATFPIYLDPTLDYQVGSSGDDCSWFDDNDNFSRTDNYIHFGRLAAPYYKAHFAARFQVTIPDDATIDSAYCSFCFSSYYGTPRACSLKFEKAANPSAVTSKTDGDGRTKTTAAINVTGPKSGTWWNTASITTILAELRGVYSYSAGAAMQVFVEGPDTGENVSSAFSWNYTGNASGPKLHVEYTPAATGNPYYAYAQQ